MTHINLFKRFGLILAVLALVAITLIVIAPRTFGSGSSATVANNNPADFQTIVIEVAEDGTRFSPDEAPVFEDDELPAYGGAFITQGYLYPEGTLADSEHGGALEDGSPESPDTDVHNRSVAGGSGAYSFIGGVQNQQFIDWNDSIGVQLTVEFQVRDLRGYKMALPTVAKE